MMARVCRRGTCRRFNHWVLEPGVGIFLVWMLFQIFVQSPERKDFVLDVQNDDAEVDIFQLRDPVRDKHDGKTLLFMEKQPRRSLQNKLKPEKLSSNDNENGNSFLLGSDHLDKESDLTAEKVRERQDSNLKPLQKTRTRVFHPMEIPNYESLPQCRGKRWRLTSKTVKMYYVAGYASTMIPYDCSSEAACDLNEGREPLKLNLTVTPCQPEDCLTVTVKTRFRYENCIRFINSIHEVYPKMRVIVMDEEGREKYANHSAIQVWEMFIKGKQNLVSYVQAPPGVGYGRKLGAQLAQTKYILVVDDDYVFTQLTNIARLVEIIEKTDATVVGGDTSDGFPFAGAIRVARNRTGPSSQVHLAIYPNVFYELVQCFRNCFVTDLVKTFFVADRLAILKHGSWDAERKFYEHEDFFINLRRARLKVVNCKDIKIRHAPYNQDLSILRHKSFDLWQKHLFEKWSIGDMYICDKSTYTDRQFTCSKQRHFY